MARLPRLAISGQVHQLAQLGHAGQPVFVDDADRHAYLAAMAESATGESVAIHAYALLPSEVWLVATPSKAENLGRFMQALGRRYVAGFNRRHRRAGTVWAGRYRAAVVDPRHVLDCLVYTESLPETRGLVAAAAGWPWSSARHHLGLERSKVVTEHPALWALGNTPFDREMRYRSLLEAGLPVGRAAAVSSAALKGWALGSDAFLAALAKQTERALAPRARGRPRKQSPA